MFGLSGLVEIITGLLYCSNLPSSVILISVAVAVRARCPTWGNKHVTSPNFLKAGRKSWPL